MTTSLFQASRAGEDDLYSRVRDHERAAPNREQLERIWSEYQSYAPKSFRKKFQFEFRQRWWEMYLTVGLCRLGFPISTRPRDDGPDLLIEFGSSKVWIEAVAPTGGTTSDAVPEPVVNGVCNLPMRECLLRLTQSVTAKRDGFRAYVRKGIVSQKDCQVIALSACGLNQFGTLLDWPQPVMLRVLAGAGDLVIPLDGSAAPYSKHRDVTCRDSGSPVELALFSSDSFNSIAGVLYSKVDLLNSPVAPEESFEIYVNPNSEVIVPDVMTAKMPKWCGEQNTGQESIWQRTQPVSPPDR